MSSNSFSSKLRLRHRDDFKRVFDRRCSVADDWLIIYGCENELDHLRLGRSVSRKFGNAVRRNRLRRLYREAFRLTRVELPAGMDIILIPRQTEHPTLEQLQESLRRLVPKLKRRLRKNAKNNDPR